MDNTVVTDLLGVADVFNAYKLLLLILGGILLWLAGRFSRALFDQLMNRIPTKRFLILQFATLFMFTLYIVGVFVLLIGVIQPPKEFLLAAGGSLAVAVGIALKDVVASVIAGLTLLFDRPFRVGDRVSFGDVYGEITSIGLRSVRMQTLDDNLITIPNARFNTEIVASGNAGALEMMVVCDFHVALNEDIERAKSIIEEVIVTSRFAYLKKPVSFAIAEVIVAERLAIRIRAKAYVLDIRYEKAFQSDIVVRTSRQFNQQSVLRPALT